jgi:hypothetical protein
MMLPIWKYRCFLYNSVSFREAIHYCCFYCCQRFSMKQREDVVTAVVTMLSSLTCCRWSRFRLSSCQIRQIWWDCNLTDQDPRNDKKALYTVYGELVLQWIFQNNMRVRHAERGNESFESKGGGEFFISSATVTFPRILPHLVTCYLVDIALFHVLNRIVRNSFITASVY